MKRNILVIGIIFGLLGWSCSKVDNQSQPKGLKQSIEKNVADINTAMSKISATKGYQILSLSTNPAAKALDAGSFKDSITLSLIAGIYDYQRDTIPMFHHFGYPYRLFKKTRTSDLPFFVVNLDRRWIDQVRRAETDFSSTAENEDETDD